MTIASFLKLQRVVITPLVANGALGTAAATVDVASAFSIAQATASITYTIPSPTTTTDMQVIFIQNTGTVSLTAGTTVIPAAKYMLFTWSGTAWIANGDVSPAKFYQQVALTAGNNTITHNLNLTTPKSLDYSITEDVSGQVVVPTMLGATMLANSVVFNVIAAVPLSNITIVG